MTENQSRDKHNILMDIMRVCEPQRMSPEEAVEFMKELISDIEALKEENEL